MCDEFARSPDQRWNLARMKVPNIEGGQKVGLIGDSRGENRNIFGVCLAGHALDHRRRRRRDDGHRGFQDQLKRCESGGQLSREVSFSFVDRVL